MTRAEWRAASGAGVSTLGGSDRVGLSLGLLPLRGSVGKRESCLARTEYFFLANFF